ncbi:phosphoserine aminotransferase [Bifidobacterium parmae]|uniref:Phosphoserine aminotransferase n=1 Tax=Bifidobacterium parmae TaxID=361854 RepID=A0A2N5J665_9BIFI|nr:phosphoserine aminotransferase [Bifidobacterium parmae]
MKLRFAPILDPAVRRPAPKPVRVDLRTVFLIGTGLWCVALIVCFILDALGFDVATPLIVCAAGVVVGVLMLIWEHFDRWDYRRLGQ